MAARRLPGNIGYLKLRYFEQGEEGAAMIDAVMGLLKDTDALIIDLRENGGGGGASDTELLGHLSRAPIPMAKVTWHNADGTREVSQRTARNPAGGPLYPDKPVYVLTAKRTFSAAEEFTYDLKAAGRATLVGETTGGGANPANRPVPLSYGFRIFIPNGHVEHPTTHTNWEGVGIAPDIAVPADQALTTAYGKALALAKPTVMTPQSERERKAAIADPRSALLADQAL
jgi:C-terminal processing protease CtpA/Prc